MIKQGQITNSYVQGTLNRGPMHHQPQNFPKILGQAGGSRKNKLQHDENIKRKPQHISLHKHVRENEFQKDSIVTNRNQSHD